MAWGTPEDLGGPHGTPGDLGGREQARGVEKPLPNRSIGGVRCM